MAPYHTTNQTLHVCLVPGSALPDPLNTVQCSAVQTFSRVLIRFSTQPLDEGALYPPATPPPAPMLQVSKPGPGHGVRRAPSLTTDTNTATPGLQGGNKDR